MWTQGCTKSTSTSLACLLCAIRAMRRATSPSASSHSDGPNKGRTSLHFFLFSFSPLFASFSSTSPFTSFSSTSPFYFIFFYITGEWVLGSNPTGCPPFFPPLCCCFFFSLWLVMCKFARFPPPYDVVPADLSHSLPSSPRVLVSHPAPPKASAELSCPCVVLWWHRWRRASSP